MGDNFAQASVYARELGWYVGPICWPDPSGKCGCGRNHTERDVGKAPLTPNGYKGFSNDPDVVDAWLTSYPNANIGVDLGRSGLVVLDGDSEAGIAEILGNGVPDAPVALTGRQEGGRHHYFSRPDGCPLARKIHAGISGAVDILSDGYAILAPSMHRTGRQYQWATSPLGYGGAPEAPDWAVKILTAQADNRMPLDDTPVVPAEALDPIAGLDPETAAIREGRSKGVVKEDGSTDRSDTIYKLAVGLAKAELSVDRIASEIAGWDARQARPKYARRKDANRRYRETAEKAVASVQTNGAMDLEVDDSEDKDEVTQTDWRDRYMARYPNTRFGLQSWRRYDQGAWDKLEKQVIRRELADLMGRAATNFLVRDVTALLEDKVFVPDFTWNSNTDALPFQNITLDLETLGPRDHSPLDYCTERLPYDYDPRATCPAFDAYMDAQFSPEVQSWLEEYMGYSLTFDVRFEMTLWLVGPRGSGKSTLIEAFQAMLAGMYGSIKFNDLTNRFALAGIPGKRLLVSAEQQEGFLDGSDVLNQLISGDVLTGERKHLDTFNFRSTAKIVMAMNELPGIKNPDNGIVRRAKIVRFAARPEDQQDTDVKERIKMEGAGIINRAIRGLERLRQRGKFSTPTEITAAVEEFKVANDVAGTFLAEMAVREPASKVGGQTLYTAYEVWCRNNGHSPKSSVRAANDWRRLGLTRSLSNGKSFWKGVRLLNGAQHERVA